MRLKNLMPTEAKLQLYKAAILPHLTICHFTWLFQLATGESWSAYKKEDSEQFLRINIRAMINYWRKQPYHCCRRDDHKTFLSSCTKSNINYCHRDFVIFSNQTVAYTRICSTWILIGNIWKTLTSLPRAQTVE